MFAQKSSCYACRAVSVTALRLVVSCFSSFVSLAVFDAVMSWCQLLLDSVHVLDEMSEKSAFDLQHFRTGVDADHENDHNVRNLSPRKSKVWV